jgi:amino acid adenylation domain-containing protein/thioester reductase-like protein
MLVTSRMAFRSALDCFLMRARAQPEAPAILEDGRVVHTYESLARTALRIGASLHRRGAGPDALVGVAMPKSADFVAAVLGVWAAGAAFTALDPALPAARRAVQIREGRIGWVLTSPAHPGDIGDIGDAADLGAPGPAHAAEGGDTLAPPGLIDLIDVATCQDEGLREPVPCQPEHLAYAFWTSGSTGRPKGVAVEHRGLPGMLGQQITAFGLGPGQRSLFLLAIGFDASVSDIGTALLSGACLCIESALARPDAETLQALLRARAITYVDIPPSLLALLDPAAAPPSLATVVIGGEVCPVETVRAWATRVRLVNVYGPTEATVCTSLGACTPDWGRPLLGAPLDDVLYRVVDAELREVPDGEPGQLAIGGVQVARGYIAQPALDAVRFVALDGNDGGGARWFLTGDAVVREPGGAYRYLGRLDRQIKIRGQLAAPEELEAALAAHPGVARAHVHVRGHAGRTALIAFASARSSAHALTPDSLRAHLSERLPAWLLPQRIEILDALPETATGKIDGAALAAVVASWSAREPAGATAPAGPAGGHSSETAGWSEPAGRWESGESGESAGRWESAIADAAARVLGQADVDLRRGFVSLGGDSLTVIEMAAACTAAGLTVSASDLAADVPLRDLAHGLGTGPAMAAAVLDRAAALPADTVAEIARAMTEAITAPGAVSVHAAGAALPVPRAFLVTGATGFLGARLVLELAQRSPATLLCLVRARDAGHAWQRLRAACDAHAPGRLDALGPRVRALPGDIAAPALGLGAHMYEELAHAVDAVFHCAAQINMVAPFAALAPHNLHGTAEILRLCLRGPRKPLHYASTLSVFVATDRNAGCAEEVDDLGATTTVFGGYAQSKWAAERLVQRAAAALPASVYRLGLITGDPDGGALPARDFLTLLTRGLAAMRAVPAAWLDTLAIDITPVGFAAAAMAAIGLGAGGQAAAGTYHIAGRAPVPLRAWIEAMRAAGAIVDEVSEEGWHAQAAQPAPASARPAQPVLPSRPIRSGRSGRAISSGQPAPADPARAFALLGLCRGTGAGAFAAQRALDMFQATGIRFDTRRADAALSGTGIDRPAATSDLLARYVHRILEEPT